MTHMTSTTSLQSLLTEAEQANRTANYSKEADALADILKLLCTQPALFQTLLGLNDAYFR